jgi:hypothetical protein
MRALLDVNGWIALFDDAHAFSQRANAFVDRHGAQIATCPLESSPCADLCVYWFGHALV